ncbi:hypothetical protein DFJ73DRAFT_964054 [Zopfochytrium polystomum]|nr:hypothetical protein DFJ73DRAFT_964054 [Zopfochytrium polystomum]
MTGGARRLQPVRIEWWEFKNYADQVDSALRAAALHNDVDVLGWWTAHANAFSSHVEVSVAKIAAAALAAGNVGLLQWCRDTHGWNPRNIDPAVLRLAAASDRADALRWLETELAPGSDDDNADRDDDVLRQVSALNFSDDALQLAQLRRRPANSLDLRKVAQHAAANGQVAVLDWIKATAAAGRGEFAPENVVRVATAAGHVAVLHWWRLNYPHDSWKPDSGCMEQACEGGHVEVLQFWRATAEAQKLEFYPSMLWYAAREGRVAVFRWWSERFPAPDSRASETLVQEAVLGEHLELLDWFRSSGFVRDMVCDISVAVRSPKAFALCARNRLRLKKRTENLRGLIERHALNLDIIRWLRERRDDGGGRNGDDDDDDTWSSVPSDQDWPRMSLLQLAAGFSSDKSPYYVWYDSDLDALEWWWRERGAQEPGDPGLWGAERAE